jgi:hypothetical protein
MGINYIFWARDIFVIFCDIEKLNKILTKSPLQHLTSPRKPTVIFLKIKVPGSVDQNDSLTHVVSKKNS